MRNIKICYCILIRHRENSWRDLCRFAIKRWDVSESSAINVRNLFTFTWEKCFACASLHYPLYAMLLERWKIFWEMWNIWWRFTALWHKWRRQWNNSRAENSLTVDRRGALSLWWWNLPTVDSSSAKRKKKILWLRKRDTKVHCYRMFKFEI